MEKETIINEITDNKIEIQKYSYINNYQALINGIINAFYEIYKIPIKLTDNNKTIIEIHNENPDMKLLRSLKGFLKDIERINKMHLHIWGSYG